MLRGHTTADTALCTAAPTIVLTIPPTVCSGTVNSQHLAKASVPASHKLVRHDNVRPQA